MEESRPVSRWSFQAQGRYIRPIKWKRIPLDRGKAPPLLKVEVKISFSLTFSVSVTFINISAPPS